MVLNFADHLKLSCKLAFRNFGILIFFVNLFFFQFFKCFIYFFTMETLQEHENDLYIAKFSWNISIPDDTDDDNIDTNDNSIML